MESRREDMLTFLNMMVGVQEQNMKGASNGRWLPLTLLREHFQEFKVEIGTPPMMAQRCVNNSIQVVADARHEEKDAKYFEGFVFAAQVVPIVHAWVCINGRHLDYTLRESPGLYYGIEIPMPVVLFAAGHKLFELAVGVLETLAILSTNEQKRAITLWREFAIPGAPRP